MIGRETMASQTGRGMRTVSTKQVVGMGEEREECGPWRCQLLVYVKDRKTYEAFWTSVAEHDCEEG